MQEFGSFLIGPLALLPKIGIARQRLTYPVVATGQSRCYDKHREITCPQPGRAFHGQEALAAVRLLGYTLSPDGQTVQDKHTGLSWQRSPDLYGDGSLARNDKLTGPLAKLCPSELYASRHGGCNDWRLPNGKELQSIADYARSPDFSASAAINPLFDATPMVNETGQGAFVAYYHRPA